MCFEFDAVPPAVPASRLLPGLAGGAAAEILTLESGDGTKFSAALAECPEPTGGPAIVVLPDVRGLYRFYIELAERFVTVGSHAIAIDYFGRTAGTGEREEDFDFITHKDLTTPTQVQADVAAAIAILADRTGAESFVTLGFCFGGGQSDLCATNPDLDLEAVISFYGTLDPSRLGSNASPNSPAPLKHVGEIAKPVLAIFGGADPMIPAEDVESFGAALDANQVPNEIHVYPGAPHSFFDRSQEEFAEASADAWERVLDFLGRIGRAC